MEPRRAGRTLARLAFGAVVLAAGILVARNAILFSRNLTTDRDVHVGVEPLYGYERAPQGSPFDNGGKCGADYACLYFAARNYAATSVMYDGNSDPWRRPAYTFPPILIFLTAHTLARPDFPASVLASDLLQVLLFLGVSAYFMREPTGSSLAGIAACWTFAGVLLFCTPVGLTWFERSQTDLYVASASLLLVKGMRDGSTRDFVGAGLVGSLKWSGLPFVAMAGMVYVLWSPQARRRKIALVGLALGIPLLIAIVFGHDAFAYFHLIMERESQADAGSGGLALAQLLPAGEAWIVASKGLPFVLPAALLALAPRWARSGRAVATSVEMLWWGAASYVGGQFGTYAFAYRLVASLFVVALVVDGRPILLRDRHSRFSGVARAVGLVSLAYTFYLLVPGAGFFERWRRNPIVAHTRLAWEATAFWNRLIGYHREVVPLVTVLATLLLVSLLARLERT